MPAAIFRSEFEKLFTTRAPWLILAAGPLIVVAGVSGLVLSGDVHDPATLARALAHIGLAGFVALIFGILAVAGEYRHGTITDTYLSFPARGRVVVAKLAVFAGLGAVAGLVCAGAGLAAAAAWWSAKGGAFSLTGADSWRVIGGGIAVNALFAAIGVGLGALVRNLVGAIAAALAWIAVVEGIAGQLIGSGLARWLPYYASEALGRTPMGPGTGLLPQWGGGLVLLGYAAIFAGAAVLTTLRRDVT